MLVVGFRPASPGQASPAQSGQSLSSVESNANRHEHGESKRERLAEGAKPLGLPKTQTLASYTQKNGREADIAKAAHTQTHLSDRESVTKLTAEDSETKSAPDRSQLKDKRKRNCKT